MSMKIKGNELCQTYPEENLSKQRRWRRWQSISH